MTITKLIAELEEIKKNHGSEIDIGTFRYNGNYDEYESIDYATVDLTGSNYRVILY